MRGGLYINVSYRPKQNNEIDNNGLNNKEGDLIYVGLISEVIFQSLSLQYDVQHQTPTSAKLNKSYPDHKRAQCNLLVRQHELLNVHSSCIQNLSSKQIKPLLEFSRPISQNPLLLFLRHLLQYESIDLLHISMISSITDSMFQNYTRCWIIICWSN